jgi:hypothetical protein
LGSYASLQIFEPPGITSDADTPNFLRDLSNAVYQTQWTDMTQGGLASAQFDCRQDYGDIVDIVFGSYVLWGLYGCLTSAHASAGDGTLTVTGLLNEQFSVGQSFPDLQIGDVVMLTDGANTELFSISNITGSSPTWTLHLDKPGSSALDLPSTLLNNYAIGATVVKLQFQGFLSQRVHSTAFDNQFSVNASGFFNRYAQMLVTENVQSRDGGTWLYTHLLSESGGSELNSTGPGYPGHSGGWPIDTTTFGCSDLASLLVGEIISIGLQEGNKENFTIDSINIANGTFTVHTASTQNHDVGETVSPEGIGQAPSLPDLVIAKSLMTHPNSTSVNLQSSDQPMAEMIAAVVRQETGSNLTKTWACWADVLRQVHHVAIDSVPPNIGETKMTIDAPPGSSTFHVADIKRIKVGRRVFITGAAGMDSLKVSAVHTAFNSFDTVGSSTFDHPPKDKVVIIYDVTPGFTLSQSENGSSIGDTINKIQTTDQDGTQLMNAVIATGTVISANGQVGTTLASAVVAGATSVPCASMPFENGDTVTLVSVGGVHTENVVLTADPVGNRFTCTPLQYNHNLGIAIVLASGSGAGPRIIMFESTSIGKYGYYEGELSSSDITDRASLVKWTKQQIEIAAWPVINAAIDLDTASCRIDGRTLLGIIGFSDGVPLYVNVAQVQYQWLAATRNATASIQAGQLKSTAGSVLKELANRHAIRDHHKNPRKRPHGFDGHMGGGDIAPNSDNTFALAAATVKFGGSVYQLPAVTSQTAPEGVSFWGVDLSNPAAPALNLMPSVVWNGRYVYAEAIYEASDDDGVDATLVSEFTGVPLWKVEVRGGVIFGVCPLFATDGVTLSNLPSIALPPAPTFSSAIPSAAAIGNGIGSDLSIAVSFTNIPQDDATHEIKYYVRTSGTTAWSHKFTRKIPGLPQPASSLLADSPVFQNTASSGTAVDIGASYAGTNGESTVAVLVSNYVIPGQGASSATETTQAVVTSATRILVSNANRQAVIIYNTANSTLFVGTDNTTTPTHFMDEIGPRQRWTMPVAYTGELWVVWAAADSVAGAQANIAAFPS